MKTAAFIPIKLNNQRLPGKNLLPLNGKPVCAYLFSTLGAARGIDEKYVYCSEEEIKKYMPPGIRFLKRDKKLDGNEVKGLAIIEAFVRDVDADIYVLAHVTSPFLKKETLENALERVKNNDFDSAFSAQKLQSYCWYQNRPINYDRKDIVTTQNVEPVYLETSGFFIFRKEVFTQHGQRIGQNPYIAVVDAWEGVDIDTPEDFAFAQAVAKFLEGSFHK